MFKSFMTQLSRITHELTISAALLVFLLSGTYAHFPNNIQTIALKATLASLGFLHAHATTKLTFPAIDWANDNTDKMEKILRIVLYASFMYAYSHGG
ncbi:hypothetical protein [Geobacter sp. SVR]|uniref:hypothetical protein n=1 Tax=Geobacter sp. SVR TaxID=2495594 RepID=UPI00143EFF3E|nr:hypothetical protein [Geobacter sp. SVR]BCS54059.1 hypothetical protein GSVR_23670 [Geobacter sp. SVR]GCF87542.1 hypothetical protein GSbR_41420 [Geobacter sp. SVR]